ncbi:hypothetical protein P171DRAFT_431553 [Karstenula rhodostoma CBS 690.94]|uniref:Uncharacterized protein n=1 Tax=Karstenula rhodostoma CBS 690.94 TaxID=1392251 RepID=A0A9P4UC19_9PLEO|nr:hypothetical protein P171DRAFT_431553 [Karstenula rhodostoma CBS 690.94]
MHLSIRDTYPFGTAEGGKYRPHPHEPNPDEYGVDTYVKGIKYRPYPYEPGVHGHDEYLPGPGPHTQEEIDAAVHYVSPPDTVTKEDLDSIPADAETRLQLLHRSTDPVGAGEDKKHHLHSHEDYLEELDRTYRLHGHDEYLEGSGAGAAEIPEPTSGDAKEVLDDKVQRRCIWGQSCQDICTMGGLVGLIGCTWNCGGDVNMPTCPESGDIEA